MTVEAIMSVVTALVTFFFGWLNKKINLTESDYIPIQNLLIGIASGLMVYAVGINDNIIVSIAICTISAFGAGGIYDLSKTKRSDKNES